MKGKWKWMVGGMAVVLGLFASQAWAAKVRPSTPGLEAPTLRLGGAIPGDKAKTTIKVPSKAFTYRFGIRPVFRLSKQINFDLDSDAIDPARRANEGNAQHDFDSRLETRMSWRASRTDQHGDLWNLDLVLEGDQSTDGNTDAAEALAIERIRGEYRVGDLVQQGLPVYFAIGWWLPKYDDFVLVDVDDDFNLRLDYAGDNFYAEVMYTLDSRPNPPGNVATGAPVFEEETFKIIRGRLVIPLGDFELMPAVYFTDDARAGRDVEMWYFGGQIKGKPKGLPIDFVVAGYGVSGNVERLGRAGLDLTNSNGVAFARRDQFDDISSFVVAGAIGYKLTPGWRIHAGALFANGDDDPFDSDLTGYVGQGAATGVAGPQNSSSIFGDDVPIWGSTLFGGFPTGKGIGPTIGDYRSQLNVVGGGAGTGFDPAGRNRTAGGFGAVPSATNDPENALNALNVSANTGFFGRGDNPGMIQAWVGAKGKLAPAWTLDLLVNFLWYDAPESIEAEIDQANCINNTGVAGNPVCATRAGINANVPAAALANIDSFFGTVLGGNLTWKPVPQFAMSFRPSILIPSDGASDQLKFAPGTKDSDDIAARIMFQFAFRY